MTLAFDPLMAFATLVWIVGLTAAFACVLVAVVCLCTMASRGDYAQSLLDEQPDRLDWLLGCPEVPEPSFRRPYRVGDDGGIKR